jgi:hypothetical protein
MRTLTDAGEFFDQRWGALIGGFQKASAIRHTFDGRSLICSPTLRVRAFYFIVSIALLGGLGLMLYRILGDPANKRLDTGEIVALVAAAIFIPILILQLVWAFRYERTFAWDFATGAITATRRDFGRRRHVEMPAADVSAVETVVVQRLRGRKSQSGTIDCHVLNLRLSDGQLLSILETTDAETAAAVRETITQHAQLAGSV